MIPLAQNPPTKLKKNFLNLDYTMPLVITGFWTALWLNLRPSYDWIKLALKGQIVPIL